MKGTKLHLKEMIKLPRLTIVALMKSKVHSSQVMKFLVNSGVYKYT